MKVKVNNSISGDAKQLEILPRISLFWNDGTYCIGIGWVFIEIDFWFGDIGEIC